jgi:hypothetical protein
MTFTKEVFQAWVEAVLDNGPSITAYLRRYLHAVRPHDPKLAALLQAHVRAYEAILEHLNTRTE